MLERRNEEIRRRTRVVRIFPNTKSVEVGLTEKVEHEVVQVLRRALGRPTGARRIQQLRWTTDAPGSTG